jgi:16S rRNA (uracil1498-N3)-methyltransferase
VFRTLEKLETQPLTPRVILCAALFKFDRFEWMIEKATELGVTEITPVETARSDRGLERAAQKRVERWRRIALEASQQSRRSVLPAIHDPVRMEEALELPLRHRYALDENPGGPRFDQVLETSAEIAILVGPEGGWTAEERESFMRAGWTPVSLGPLILRAETAAIAALAIAAAKLAD